MTESSHNVFIDRRSEDEKRNGLATQVLFWYDQDSKKKKRRRTNGIAVTLDGRIIIARSTCSSKDQFVRSLGRMKVSSRIFGRARKHCWELPFDLRTVATEQVAEQTARLYAELFPNDDMGTKRAFNIGKVFSRFRTEVDRRVTAGLDA